MLTEMSCSTVCFWYHPNAMYHIYGNRSDYSASCERGYYYCVRETVDSLSDDEFTMRVIELTSRQPIIY